MCWYVSNRNVAISIILSATLLSNFLDLLDGKDTAVFTKLLPIALCILLHCVHVPPLLLKTEKYILDEKTIERHVNKRGVLILYRPMMYNL